ncbi:hypothetical protein, partial [Nocardiopsis alba]|uniref:hypothetical protein n=1 Tax=Nocardiopsis alba TaxID=53437 RepID=UPI0033FB340E
GLADVEKIGALRNLVHENLGDLTIGWVMSPASYRTAPPRVVVFSTLGHSLSSGKSVPTSAEPVENPPDLDRSLDLDPHPTVWKTPEGHFRFSPG